MTCLPSRSSLAAEPGGAGDPTEREGPLKDLPNQAGPHVAKIGAMKDGSWLDLGAPKADPKWGVGIGRGWCGKMPYAPDLRGAFLYGEGRHGGYTVRNGKKHYNDDLFFYDVNGHRWVCVYPGMEVGAYNLTINKDGFEVDARGNPLPVACFVHSYNMMTYDVHRKMFVHLWSPSGYWRKRFPKRLELVTKNAHKLNGLGRGWSKINQASPWMYDTVAGHWRRFKTQNRTPGLGHGSHLIYLAPLKKLFCLGKGGAYFYDPADNNWHALKPGGPRPPNPIDAASCYDPKRNRVYIAMGSYPKAKTKAEGIENRVWAYDVGKNAWVDLKAKGDLPPRPRAVSGCGISKMHYDSKNDAVVFFALGPDLNESLKTRGIYAYTPEKNEWKKVLGRFPDSWGKGASHCFYDPHLNAHFIYKARGSKGQMFVYRYRTP